MLSFQAIGMMSDNWILSIIAIIIIILFKDSKYLPASIILVAGGIALMYFRGDMAGVQFEQISLPAFKLVKFKDMWQGMVLAGFAQIPLTATNAVIATAVLLKEYWPDNKVTERHLSANMGIMNLIFPLFGGMPLCHGSGGLAGQYTFGARTGGANIMEGTMEVLLGLFLGSSIAILFGKFPLGIIGSMMIFVGYKLIKRGYDALKGDLHLKKLIPILSTAIGAVVFNMAIGFILGMLSYYVIKEIEKRQNK